MDASKIVRSMIGVLSVCLTTAVGISHADNLDRQKKALDIIGEFADKICKDIPLEVTSERVELTGKAKADLNIIIKSLVDLGFEGAAKYSTSNSKGILQADLAKAIKDNSECKLQVFGALNDKLITTATQQSGKGKIIMRNIEASRNGRDGIHIEGYEGNIEMENVITEGNGEQGINIIPSPK